MSQLVSVVMPAHNAARYLHESVDSVLAQTYRNFELIIVDDNSTDTTADVLQSFADDRIVVKRNATKLGPAQSRNEGIRIANGQYIACLDADDVALPERLELQVDFLTKHPEIALVGGAAITIDECGKEIGTHYPLIDPEEIRRTLPKTNCFVQSTVMVRAEALRKAGNYRFPLAEDYDLWLRVSEHFGVANLSDPLVRYRTHGQQTSLRKIEELTLWAIAARCSARFRRELATDPLATAEKITPQLLRTLGAAETEISGALVEGFLLRIETDITDSDFSRTETDNLRCFQSIDKKEKREVALRLLSLAQDSYYRELYVRSAALIRLGFKADRNLLMNKRWSRLALKLMLGERVTDFIRGLKRILPSNESSAV